MMKKTIIILYALAFFAVSDCVAATATIYVGAQQQAGYAVYMDGSQSIGRNPNGLDDIFGIREYSWDFGDGSEEEFGEFLNTASHVYNSPGSYTIKLTVVDYTGETAETTAVIL